MSCTWVMFQKWRNLLFMSWPFPPEVVQKRLPPDIEIDTYDGSAWLSLIPLRMEDLHFRWFPPVPGTSDFPELNLRTYVKVAGETGVFFFSIDAKSCLGALVARHVFHLPYLYADMTITPRTGGFRMVSHRKASRNAKGADFDATYKPTGTPQRPVAGSLGHFLVERYSAFAEPTPGVVYSGPIKHAPWRLQGAEVEVRTNTVLSAAGFEPQADPVVHFSPGTDSELCLVTPMHLKGRP